MSGVAKRRLVRPIDRLRQRAGISELRAAVLRDKLKAVEAEALRDRQAVDAEEVRRAEKAAARAYYFEGGR